MYDVKKYTAFFEQRIAKNGEKKGLLKSWSFIFALSILLKEPVYRIKPNVFVYILK